MQTISEREQKKGKFSKRSAESSKKYAELYAIFSRDGYSKTLAADFSSYFVDDAKKPFTEDILQAARLYDRIHDLKTAAYYLDKLEEVKKLPNDDKFAYCVDALKNKSKIGNWRDAEDFRTQNIDFMQKYSVKAPMAQQADLYIALALVDCAAKHYTSAFRLLTGFGYKPVGKNDKKLLEILVTGVYICAKSGDHDGLDNAVDNAYGALRLFTDFEHSWTRSYYEKCIQDAAQGII